MKVSFPVAVSGQLALAKQLDSIANNIANSRTAGFRAEATSFSSVISRTGPQPVTFSRDRGTYITRQAGPLVKTGNPLDVAVQGEAWMAVQSPNGTVYTRDGRLQLTPTGELLTITGYPVLDVGGSAIQLDPKGGKPVIARDGMISQAGKQSGAIGLFAIDKDARLTRFDTSSVIPDKEPVGIIDFGKVGLLQGFIEQSNVNAIMEMSRLIKITRTFDMLNSFTADSERTAVDAIKTLGAGR